MLPASDRAASDPAAMQGSFLQHNARPRITTLPPTTNCCSRIGRLPLQALLSRIRGSMVCGLQVHKGFLQAWTAGGFRWTWLHRRQAKLISGSSTRFMRMLTLDESSCEPDLNRLHFGSAT